MPVREHNRWGVMVDAIALAGALDFTANWLAAHCLRAIGPFVIPSGSLTFALAFTTYDYIRRFHGLWPTVAAIVLGFSTSVAYGALFGGGIGRIAVAGLVALACSSTTDLLTQTVTLRWPIWKYVSTSNAVSLLVDTVVFTTIAFAALPTDVRLHIMAGQYLAKIVMTFASVPLVYGARAWAARATAPERAVA
jgi:uncharacterized PurR-regulated membrane protein YhhQ (DUF165 family)